MKEIYKKYKRKGLEVYVVSLDQNKEILSDIIIIESLNRITVSGVFGTAYLVKKLYNFPEELPYFYLIDKKGNIITNTFKLPEVLLSLRQDI